ncbi:hypothetical protein [Mycoplasma sp. ATU-Cv-508]|uniref:hypothetical protein n=1 Tax=Mycoplasma sp. ATU-Cv-508 TaxID=2048001 RepID=UPI001F393E4E
MDQPVTWKKATSLNGLNKWFRVGVGDALLGRVVNALGEPMTSKKLSKDWPAGKFPNRPRVMTREEVNQPIETGILAIDSMIPIGKGQREFNYWRPSKW